VSEVLDLVLGVTDVVEADGTDLADRMSSDPWAKRVIKRSF
jgi:hypothetical protein